MIFFAESIALSAFLFIFASYYICDCYEKDDIGSDLDVVFGLCVLCADDTEHELFNGGES